MQWFTIAYKLWDGNIKAKPKAPLAIYFYWHKWVLCYDRAIRFRLRYVQIMTSVKFKVLKEQFKETAVIQLFTSTLNVISIFDDLFQKNLDLSFLFLFFFLMPCRRIWMAFVLLSLVWYQESWQEGIDYNL